MDKVYVLLVDDYNNYDDLEYVGVFKTLEKAKQIASDKVGDMDDLDWFDNEKDGYSEADYVLGVFIINYVELEQ